MRSTSVLSLPFLFTSLVASVVALGCGSSDGGPAASDDGGPDATSDTATGDSTNHDTSIDAKTDAKTDTSTDAHVDSTPADTTPLPDGGTIGPASVLQHHDHANRDGVYVDASMTKAAAATVHRDTGFSASIGGAAYAQPLFVDGGGPGGKDVLYVVTEQNDVYCLDASSGAVVWHKTLGAPIPRLSMPCGNGDLDAYGVSGTPIIDPTTRTLYVDASTTPDAGTTQLHLVFALSIDDGSTRTGWPVDPQKAVPGFNDDASQGERGALALVGGTLYVPYGGLYGDCGNYHGVVVAISTTSPTTVTSWKTVAQGGGVWAPGGIASDGTSLFVSTGNTMGASAWGGGEALIRLGSGATFSGATTDYFAPSNWMSLDASDTDLGGSGALPVHVPGATPSDLLVGLGKDSKAYLVDRANLGGIGGEIEKKTVSTDEIIQAATTYTTASGTYVVFKGAGSSCPAGSGNLTALKISATAPPSISTAWCADQGGAGSPATSTTDGSAEAVVWGIGAEGDDRLHAFDADTGAVINDGSAGAPMSGGVHRFQTPIVAKGRVYVAGNSGVFAFTK